MNKLKQMLGMQNVVAPEHQVSGVYTAPNTSGFVSPMSVPPSLVVPPDVQRVYAEAQMAAAAQSPSQIGSDLHRMRMLMMRLRVNEAYQIPFDHISTGVGGDLVFVFVVKDGKPVTLQDDAAMFPSDALITQLRLLMP